MEAGGMAQRSKHEYLRVMWERVSAGRARTTLGRAGRSDAGMWVSLQGRHWAARSGDSAAALDPPGGSAAAHLFRGRDSAPRAGLGRVRLFMCAAPHGSTPHVAAVAAAARANHPDAGNTAGADQSPADRSPAAGAEAPDQATPLWHHASGLLVEAPDPDQDGSLGCHDARLSGDRPGLTFRGLRQRRVSAHLGRCGHSHHLGGAPGRAGQRPARHAPGIDHDRRAPAVCAARTRLRQGE